MFININYEGVEESGIMKPMPDGDYVFKIGKCEAKTSENGNATVKVELIVNEGQYEGRRINHYVTFPSSEKDLKDWGGISMHWLHCIGEPYQGNIEVNTDNWKGLVTCFVSSKKADDGNTYNEIKYVKLPDIKTTIINEKNKQDNPDDVPF
jgi:hypothetical protein